MTDKPEELAVHRLLVALDACLFGEATLAAAASLAAELRSELHGLFVEDVDLLRLAGFPFAQEIGYPSAVPRRINLPGMERLLRAKIEELERSLLALAEQAGVRSSFRVVRGRVLPAVLLEAAEADLIILGRQSARRRAGPSAKSTEPILVLYDGSPASQRALHLAVQLAQRKDRQLTVLVEAADDDSAKRLREQAASLSSLQKLTATFHEPNIDSADALAEAVRQRQGRLLLASREDELLSEDAVNSLITSLDCLLGLVR